MLGKEIFEYWEENQGWRWDPFNQLLPDMKLLRVADTVILNSEEAKDTKKWLDEIGGHFTMKSAYKLACRGGKDKFDGRVGDLYGR